MYSYKHFSPGQSTFGATNIIHYQVKRPEDIVCGCYKRVSKTFVDQVPQRRVSRAVRVANVVRSTRGGKVHFGNYYYVEPVFNYLGKVAGQPGGSGAPVRNRF
jgi:hypothetical protein